MTVADPDELRQTADDIVARPEFAEEQPTLVQRALDWFFRELGRLFDGALGGGGGYLIGYAILAAALALAAYLVWKHLPRRRLASSEVEPALEVDTTIRRSRHEWLAEAEEAERLERWDRAVHARYHALTTGLADERELPARPSTTSGEHRAAFAARAASAERATVFDRAVERYEEVWFGGAVAEQPDSERLARADRELLAGER